MLEVCPTIAGEKPRLEVHPLGIGGREDPARLVFTAAPGAGRRRRLVRPRRPVPLGGQRDRRRRAVRAAAEPAGGPRGVGAPAGLRDGDRGLADRRRPAPHGADHRSSAPRSSPTSPRCSTPSWCSSTPTPRGAAWPRSCAGAPPTTAWPSASERASERSRRTRVALHRAAGTPAQRGEDDGQVVQAADDELGTAPRPARPARGRRRPVEQRAERGLQLDPGQRRADAEVHAGAEGDVRVVGAADVQGVRRRRTRPGRGSRAEQGGDLLRRAATVTPPISTSSVAVRSNSCSGESKRISSSIAVGSRPRSARSRSQLVGVLAAAPAGRCR